MQTETNEGTGDFLSHNHFNAREVGLTGLGVTPSLPMSHPTCHMNLVKKMVRVKSL